MLTGQHVVTVSAAITVSAMSMCLVLAACGVRTTAPARSPHGGAARATDAARPRSRTVEVAPLARSWSSDWTVIGAKSEPTYVENVRISRLGNRFTLDADAFGV